MGIILDYTEAIKEYISGLSLTDAAKKCNVDRHTLVKKLREQGIEIRPRESYWTYYLNHAAFDKITEESAYWVGFLMADGGVYLNDLNWSPHIKLEIANKDREHLVKFKEFLSADNPIIERTIKLKSGRKAKYNYLRITSKTIVDRLAIFGIVPNKTLSEKVYHLENNRHFWRGVMDGDGCLSWIRKRYPSIQLVGNTDLMVQFCDYIATHLSIHLIPRKYKNRSIFTVCAYCQKARKIIYLLYSNNKISLIRKQERAEKFFTYAPYK